MSQSIRRVWEQKVRTAAIIAAVMMAAVYAGQHPSNRLLILIAGAIGGAVLLRQPQWGLVGLIVAALISPIEINTGTEVQLNLATLIIPAMLVLWLVGMVLRRDVRLAASRANLPLVLFLLSGLLSLLIGNVIWDPGVPRSGSFIVVQLAQWAIFALSAGAFWLAGNLVRETIWLRRLTFAFLAIGGGLAVLYAIPGLGAIASRIATVAIIRAPFWALLIALAGGQLFFNRHLSGGWRLFLWLIVAAVLAYSLWWQREAASNWVGVGAVVGVLLWSRFPKLRWLSFALGIALAIAGVLFPAVYEFAGGQEEWVLSGASRLTLISRVVELTMRNPITGLGPAAYRAYGYLKPLVYEHIVWDVPNLSAHNNYVDLFSHTGLLGLGLFLWFMAEIIRAAVRLGNRFPDGFARGYIYGALAMCVGALAIMMMADWFLPFVYNIGFPGFQASVLSWLFMGGLVAMEQMPAGEVDD